MAETESRRIVQFSAVGRGVVEQIVVLCDDGSLWIRREIDLKPTTPRSQWERIEGPRG